MGMFDHLDLKVVCPKCKKRVVDVQTKDGPRSLYHFGIGQTAHWMRKLKWVDAHSTCNSCGTKTKTCRSCKQKEVGIPFFFAIEAVVKDGALTGEYRYKR